MIFTDHLEESPEIATPTNPAAEMLKQGAGENIYFSDYWYITITFLFLFIALRCNVPALN